MLLSFFFFKQKTAYEMRISDWSSDVCSSDLINANARCRQRGGAVPDAIFANEFSVRRSLNVAAAFWLGSDPRPSRRFSSTGIRSAKDHAAQIGREAGRERVCQ